MDRWKSESDAITTKVISGGITISTTAESGATELREYLEYVIPAGTMITISAIVSKTAASKNGVVRVAYTDNQVGLQANLPDRAMDYELVTVSRKATADVKAFVFRASNGDGYTVHAAKIELGSTQTLAHQEGDRWVLNEIPDYGEQLRRCQRYFQTFATKSLRPTNALDFRPVMRAAPALSTITVGGKTLYTASADL